MVIATGERQIRLGIVLVQDHVPSRAIFLNITKHIVTGEIIASNFAGNTSSCWIDRDE